MALWIAMTAGCASAPGRLQAPKAVFGLELAPYATTEECIALEPGERIGYRFEARLPVAFNGHFHEDNAVLAVEPCEQIDARQRFARLGAHERLQVGIDDAWAHGNCAKRRRVVLGGELPSQHLEPRLGDGIGTATGKRRIRGAG